jgi:hypothetical protein
MKRKRQVKKLTRAQRSRIAFEKAARKRFSLTASQAKELRKRFEARTGAASAVGLKRHPRIAAKIVPAAKGAVTRRINKNRKARAKHGAEITAPVVPIVEPQIAAEHEIEEVEELELELEEEEFSVSVGSPEVGIAFT